MERTREKRGLSQIAAAQGEKTDIPRWALLTAKAGHSCTGQSVENALQRILPAWWAVYSKKKTCRVPNSQAWPWITCVRQALSVVSRRCVIMAQQERPDSFRLTSITVKSRRLCGLRRIKRRLMHTLRGSNETGVRNVLVLRANVYCLVSRACCKKKRQYAGYCSIYFILKVTVNALSCSCSCPRGQNWENCNSFTGVRVDCTVQHSTREQSSPYAVVFLHC